MIYRVLLKEQAEEDLYKLAINEPKAFSKVQSLLEELRDIPKPAQESLSYYEVREQVNGVAE